MSDKIQFSKQEIKQDKFADFVTHSRERVGGHVPVIAGVIVAIALAVVGVYFFMHSRDTARINAEQRLADAKNSIGAGNVQVALLELETIAKDHPGTASGGEALFILANANYLQNNFDEARRRFEEYIKEYDDQKVSVASAKAGIGGCLENTGDNAGAAAKFAEALETDPDGPGGEDYCFGAMRNYLLAGDKKNGELFFKRFSKQFYSSPQLNTVQRLYFEITPVTAAPALSASPTTGQ